MPESRLTVKCLDIRCDDRLTGKPRGLLGKFDGSSDAEPCHEDRRLGFGVDEVVIRGGKVGGVDESLSMTDECLMVPMEMAMVCIPFPAAVLSTHVHQASIEL